MANVPKAITDLPVASAMGDDDLLVVSQNATTSSIKGKLIKGYAQNAVASQVTAAQTAANQAGQSATQAEAARQGAAAAQTAAENAQDAAETARDQSVAAAGTIGDSVEQAQDAASQASSAKDAAVAAQTAAEAAKTAAETASGQAQTAATQASGSATVAQTAATQAGDAKTDAETARNEAETSASSAANSASDAESAATEAEQAKTYIENMDMEGETLPAGSSVTVTKTTSPEGNLLFVIGVPQGIQGDKGDTGETGATGPQGVSVINATVNEDGDLVITLSSGSPINAGSVIGPQGIQGEVGPTGASVDRIERTSGTGAPGTTDTYTVYLTDGKTGGTFQVYNGSNGTGSGDFMADGSVPMTGDLQMGGHVVTGMADGTDPTDGATVGQLSGKLDSPTGGTAGQVLTKTADGSAWENAPSGLPDGGSEGQILYKAADGAAWGDKPVMIVNATDAGGASLTTDKTLDEIKEAYLNDVNIFIKYTDVLLPLVLAENVEGENPSFKFFNYSTSAISRDLYALIEAEIEIFRRLGEDFAYFHVREGGLVPTDGNQGEMLYCDNTGRSHWGPAPKGIPSGGTTGQVLTKTSTGEEWSDAPSGLPEGGTEGQVIKKTADGAEWDDAGWLPLSGGAMSGDINMADPTSDYDPSITANGIKNNTSPWIQWSVGDTGKHNLRIGTNGGYMGFAPESDGGACLLTISAQYGLSMSGDQIRDLGDPTEPQGAATKQYVDTQLSTKLTTPTGTQGQLLGFTADNTVGAVDAPESGLTQEQADERYLQLTGGTLTGDIMASFGQDFGIFFDESNNSISIGAGGPTFSVSANDVVEVYFEPTTAKGVVNKAYVDSKAPTSVTVTLTVDGWTNMMAPVEPGEETVGHQQTVTVPGVVASEIAQLITPTPAILSQSAYYEAGIMCTGQAANSLTFTCQTVPTSNLTVYVVIQPLN